MNAPYFERIINAVKKSPFQKKELDHYLCTRNEAFFIEAEEFATQYISYLEN